MVYGAGGRMRGLTGMAAALLLLASSAGGAQELVVSAASSLTNAFRDIGRDFEATHAGVKVVLNFAASDVLLAQIAKGAPADVFASADEAAMNRAEEGNLLAPGTRHDFAANRLVVVVPRSAAPVAALATLAEPRFRRIATGSPQTVPAGRYAKDALERANLWGALEAKLVFTQNVRQALDYVVREEADAGFVYATDAAIMPDKVKVAFDVPTTTPVRYPVAVVRDSRQSALAAAFVLYVVGAAGQQILARHGFRAR
jgi:molybdate transport system substrate-binding protein